MARITVEDCLERIPNLFDLVLTASKRSRRLANGAESLVEWENDKPTVVALREIAAGHIDVDILEENEQQQALEAVFEEEPEPAAPAPTLSSLPLAKVARPEAAQPTAPPPPKLDQEQPPAPVLTQEEAPAPVLTQSNTDAELAAHLSQENTASKPEAKTDTDAELAAHLSQEDTASTPESKTDTDAELAAHLSKGDTASHSDTDAEIAAQMSQIEAAPDAEKTDDDEPDDSKSVPPTSTPIE